MPTKIISRRQMLNERKIDTEQLDETPVEVPAFLTNRGPDNLRDMVQAMVRNEVSRAAVETGSGSFEDEDDFELEEREPELVSEHEIIEMDDPLSGTSEPLDGEPQPEAPSLPVDPSAEGQPPNEAAPAAPETTNEAN